MKKIVFIAFCCFFLSTLATNAQKTWYTKDQKITQQENATYYRTNPKKVRKGYLLKDYYKNGSLYMKGFSYNKELNKEEFHGKVIFYFNNGNPSTELNYKNGVLNGVKKIYYETGELKSTIRYKDGKQEGVWKTFYKTGKIKTKGKYLNGEKVGVWKTFYKNVY